MALLDPSHRVSTVRPPSRTGVRTASKGGIHPSICLVSGFGFIVASALLVHVAFNVLV